jgi:cyclopropane-fatty-acyl-phospholipid synthase
VDGLSGEQLAYAQPRLEGAAFGAHRAGDCRTTGDIDGPPFDAVCSIEMVEAVGHELLAAVLRTVRRLLKPGGRACIQTIVLQDGLWDRYIRSTDFIQQYIFPGGCLPCRASSSGPAAAAGLRVVEAFAFGPDYAETLRRWRERFLARRTEVLALGFDERFLRTWEFYLAYCEAAFAEGSTDVVQYTLEHA